MASGTSVRMLQYKLNTYSTDRYQKAGEGVRLFTLATLHFPKWKHVHFYTMTDGQQANQSTAHLWTKTRRGALGLSASNTSIPGDSSSAFPSDRWALPVDADLSLWLLPADRLWPVSGTRGLQLLPVSGTRGPELLPVSASDAALWLSAEEGRSTSMVSPVLSVCPFFLQDAKTPPG